MDPKRRRLTDAERGVEVLEKNTDTAWALFEAVRISHEQGVPMTPPAIIEPVAVAPAPAPAPAPASGVSLDDVLLEVRRNNRVCPLPAIWKQVWDYLPNKGTTLSEVPATAAEWARLPPLQKRSRLREHLEWAASQGVLQQVYDALRKLPEDRWHHMGA